MPGKKGVFKRFLKKEKKGTHRPPEEFEKAYNGISNVIESHAKNPDASLRIWLHRIGPGIQIRIAHIEKGRILGRRLNTSHETDFGSRAEEFHGKIISLIKSKGFIEDHTDESQNQTRYKHHSF